MKAQKSTDNTVAITGMGIVSSVGRGLQSFRNALYDGYSNFSCISNPALSFPLIGAFATDYDLEPFEKKIFGFQNNLSDARQNHITKMIRKMTYPVRMTLISVLEAWEQAKLDKSSTDPTRIGIVIAAQNSSMNYQYTLHNEFRKNPEFLNPVFALNFMDTNYIGVLSDILGILGEGFTIGGSSASGNVALIRAYQLIKNEELDACIVVGSLVDLSPMELQGFYNIGALGGHHFIDTPNEASRPFDKASDGFIYGQASGCLILESLDSALKRKVSVLGNILGGAIVLDGNYLSTPTLEGEIRAMRKAMAVTNITVNEIDYINTHGSSSPLGDKVEIAAIENLLESRNEEVMLNSTKSIIGHCLWSAGIIETIATLIQMNENFFHVNLNLEDPISKNCNFVTASSKNSNIRIALKNSFGFGGINSSIVISKS